MPALNALELCPELLLHAELDSDPIPAVGGPVDTDRWCAGQKQWR